MKIRLAQEQDLNGIAEIWNYYILKSSYNYDYEPKSITYFEDWLNCKREQNWPVLVIEENNEILGYGSFELFKNREGYLHSFEHMLYLKATVTGKGYGKLLFQRLKDVAIERKAHTLIGGIDSKNIGSIAFHEKLGFKEVARFKQVGYKNDTWLDCVYMQLML